MLSQSQPVFPSVLRASYSALLASVHSMAFVELQPPRTFPLVNSIRIRLLLCLIFELPWLIDCLASSKSLGSSLMDGSVTGPEALAHSP